MAKKTISPIEQHVEKVVVGIAGAALIASAVYFFALGVPYSESIWTNETAGVGDLGKKLEDAARNAMSRFQQIPAPPPPDANTAGSGPVKLVNPFNLSQYMDVTKAPPVLAAFPPPLVEGDSPSTRKPRPLVNIVAPSRPVAAAFRNVLQRQVAESFDEVMARGGLSGTLEQWPETTTAAGGTTNPLDQGRPWAIVAATIDLEEQRAAFRAAEYPPDFWDLTAFDVELQRRVVTRLVDGEVYGPWETVQTWVPFQRPEIPQPNFAPDGSLTPAEREGLTKLWVNLGKAQKWILRPDPLTYVSGDRIKEPDVPYLRFEPEGFFDETKPPGQQNPELKRMAGQWIREAEDWLRKNPREPEPAYVFAEAAYHAADMGKNERANALRVLESLDKAMTDAGKKPPNPKRELRRRMPMLAYDMNIEPGAAYQWRSRLRAFNRYVGRPFDLARTEDARKVLIGGAWSEPTTVVEVPANLYMFLTRATNGKPEVTVEVFRKPPPGGKAPSKRYTGIKVGDSIGKAETRSGAGRLDFSTDAIVVDIDTNYIYKAPGSTGPGEPTVLVTYTSSKYPDVLREMVLAVDVKSKKYQELTASETTRRR